MKKMLGSIALLFLATFTFAGTSVTIHNYTTYPISFILQYSSDPTNYCQIDGQSNILSISNGTSVTYNFSTNVPSGITATSGAFVAGIPLQGNGCPGAISFPVGNPCLSLHTYAPSERFLNSSCTMQIAASITWDYSDYDNPILTIQ